MENILINTIKNILDNNDLSDIESINKNNIVRNLRNDEFITRLLLRFHENIPYTKIYEFVKKNNELHQIINNYEQKVILIYLQDFIKHIDNEQYELNDLEEIFRQSIINNLISLGINKIAIEKCLEINNNLWFNQCIEKSFNSQFHYEEETEESYYHKLYYLKMKRYTYYQKHRYIVALYGNVTPEMLMTENEAKELQIKLLNSNEKYKQLIFKK